MKIFSYKTLGLLVAVFVVTFAVGALLGQFLDGGLGGSSLERQASRGKPVNILMMGIDARGIEENSRSDTMIMASIDPKNNKVAMVWIPRDTRIKDDKGRYNKINSVNILDGPEAACETVSDLLGTKVDYYMVTNFEGFADIIDTLGGVTINVEGAMRHYDPDPRLNINLSSGVQKLDGQDALRYVRYRGGPTADIGRTGRQQKFVKALVAEMFKTNTIVKLPKLLPQLSKNINTNIPMSDMLYMVKLARELDNVTISTQTLPGYPYTEPSSGASYWLADDKLANGIVERMFSGEKFDVAQDPPKWVNEQRQSASTETTVDENGNTEAPMSEDATLEKDFAGEDALITGVNNADSNADNNADNITNDSDNSKNPAGYDNTTIPAEPVNPQDQTAKPATPAANNPNGSPQPSVSSPASPTTAGPTGSSGY